MQKNAVFLSNCSHIKRSSQFIKSCGCSSSQWEIYRVLEQPQERLISIWL